MLVLDITSNNGRDLYAETKCTCVEQKWLEKGINIKTTIRFSGYNDDYFFNVVNKNPQERDCSCGAKYSFQWKQDGVHIELKNKEK